MSEKDNVVKVDELLTKMDIELERARVAINSVEWILEKNEGIMKQRTEGQISILVSNTFHNIDMMSDIVDEIIITRGRMKCSNEREEEV